MVAQKIADSLIRDSTAFKVAGLKAQQIVGYGSFKASPLALSSISRRS